MNHYDVTKVVTEIETLIARLRENHTIRHVDPSPLVAAILIGRHLATIEEQLYDIAAKLDTETKKAVTRKI